MTKLGAWCGIGMMAVAAMGAGVRDASANPPIVVGPVQPPLLPPPKELIPQVTVTCPLTIAAFTPAWTGPTGAVQAALMPHFPAAAVSSATFDGTTLSCQYTPASGTWAHVDVSGGNGSLSISGTTVTWSGRVVYNFPGSVGGLVNAATGISYASAPLQSPTIVTGTPSATMDTATGKYQGTGFASIGVPMPAKTTNCALTDAVNGVVTCTRILI